jgi:hypothetical protein
MRKVLIASSAKGVRLYRLSSFADLSPGKYDSLFKSRCHDLALIPGCTPKKRASHMTWFLTSGEDARGGSALVN